MTNVTEVMVLNCDCEELGFGVGKCCVRVGRYRAEVSMSARFCDDGWDGDVCVRG